MYNPKDISLIVPCHNEGKSIAHCIHSISIQSIKPAEIIFVDNCSTDNTVEEIQLEIQSSNLRVATKIIKESNRGIPFARNAGINSAKGRIIVFLDADCVAPCNYIRLILEDFNTKNNINAVAGKYILKGQDTVLAAWRQRAWSKHFGWDNNVSIIKSINDQNGVIVSGCSAYLKSTLEELGLFDKKFVYMDDVALSEKFYKAGSISLRDGRITVIHNIDTSEKTIMNKDYRYGSDRALIYKLADNIRFKFHTKHYTTFIKALIKYARVRDKYYLYEIRTLLYFKIGLFIRGLKIQCLYI